MKRLTARRHASLIWRGRSYAITRICGGGLGGWRGRVTDGGDANVLFQIVSHQ
jgi:hypothetical protein